MKKTLTTMILTSISEVLETMFFIPVEPEEEELSKLPDIGSDLLAASLKFKGDRSGDLVIIAPRIVVEEMAENLMGLNSENVEEEYLTGTLTELLNMVCGNALSRADASNPYELAIPEIILMPEVLKRNTFHKINTPQSALAISVVIEE